MFPNLIADAQQHAGARELPVTHESGIGAYIGIALHRADGSLYGTLCGLTASARPDLADEHIATLAQFGDQIAPLLNCANLVVSAP